MASRRKAIFSTGTLSSIREYEGEEDDDDGESIDMMGFLAEGEDIFGEHRIPPVKQEDREDAHVSNPTTPPFDRHRMLELHGQRLKQSHDALVKCLSKSESEPLEGQVKSSIGTTKSHRWTPSEDDLNKVYGQAVPHLRGGALLPRPQLITRPSEASTRVSDSNLTASTGFLNSRGHARASVADSGLGYGGYSRGSIVAEGSVASWYPGVDQRGEVVEVDGGNDEGPITLSSEEKEKEDTQRKKESPIHLASPMASPRRSTWRNFSRPPGGSLLSEGSKLESSVEGSTVPSQTFFAPGEYADGERRSSLG